MRYRRCSKIPNVSDKNSNHFLKASDWQKRVAQLDRIKTIFQKVTEVYSQNVHYVAISYLMRHFQPEIISQINDLRSSVAKAACGLVGWMAVVHPQEFGSQGPKSGGNGVRYFKDDALYKLIGCGIKTLSDMAHATIVEILEATQIAKLAPMLNQYLGSKNTLLRLRTAQYYEICMN